MAVGCLMTRTNLLKFREVANYYNCKTCSMSAMYNAQNEEIPDIIEVRQESFSTKKRTITTIDNC